MPNDDTITITEAARRLNVSERTVYRLMKTGRLTRIYQYDNVRLMTEEVLKLRLERGQITTEYVRQETDTDTRSLREQVIAKDAQISQLLARQEEMSRILARLQEQLYELTQYVLSQAKTPPRRGFLASFWKRERPQQNVNSGEKT